MSAGEIIAIAAVLVLSGFTAASAAAETALTRMSHGRVGALVAEQRRGATALDTLLADRQAALAPLLLLRVIGHVATIAIVVAMVSERAGTAAVVGAAAVAAASIYVLTEAIPRIWALQRLDRAALRSALLLRVVLRVAPLRAITRVLNFIANVILPGPSGSHVVSEDELIAMTEVAAADDSIDEEERVLIGAVFALGDTIVREVMVPRTDMTTTSATATISEVLDLAEERGFSRMPVCGDGIDDIIGVCLVKDLIRVERTGGGDRVISSLMRKPRFVPETKHADDLLREMQAGNHHIAIVVDEYGGTAGLVSLEDLVEELVGEIVDEYDHEEPLFQPLAGGNLLVHGRMPVDQLEGLLGLEFADGDWDTVGGLIFNSLGHVPDVGEMLDVLGVRLHVERIDGRRITRVRVERVAAEAAAEGDR